LVGWKAIEDKKRGLKSHPCFIHFGTNEKYILGFCWFHPFWVKLLASWGPTAQIWTPGHRAIYQEKTKISYMETSQIFGPLESIHGRKKRENHPCVFVHPSNHLFLTIFHPLTANRIKSIEEFGNFIHSTPKFCQCSCKPVPKITWFFFLVVWKFMHDVCTFQYSYLYEYTNILYQFLIESTVITAVEYCIILQCYF